MRSFRGFGVQQDGVLWPKDPSAALPQGAPHSLKVLPKPSAVRILYDRGRFLVASAATDINDLYAGHQWRFEFDRTTSRLGEMVARGQTTGS